MTARFIPAVLLAMLPSLAPAQVPAIQPPPIMAANAPNAALPNTLLNLGARPHVASNVALAAKSNASAPQGIVRDHYAAGGFADGPTFFMPQTGVCAANGWVNDGGNCVDGPDGNSWKALHQHNILNVKEFGALGNNSSDDTAAIQAAITAGSSATPGVFYDRVVFPSGNYCISTAGGVTATAARLALIGYGNAILKVCGAHDTTVLTLNGNAATIENLQILGYNSTSATRTALVIGQSCVDCTVDGRTLVQYGYHAISDAAPDAKIWAKASLAYGPSLAVATGGAFWLRNKFDQNYPAGAPPAGPYRLAAWARTHSYVNKDLVTIGSGAWVLQQTGGACTSGSVEPAAAAYNTNITDNSCTWQLAAPATYYALELQTGAAPTFVEKLDCTGPFSYCAALDKGGSGSGPQLVTLRDINAGADLSGGVYAAAGQGLAIEGGSATGCVLAGCKAINLTATWGQNAHIGAGFAAHGNAVGIYLGGGTGTLVSGTSLRGSSIACIDIAAGVSDFAITGNDLSKGAVWGSCTASIKVETGAGDRYAITDNLVSGIAPVDGGRGTHKTIIGNH